MTTQRKIKHLLASAGTGAEFRYLPQLAVPFDFSRAFLVTEKADGSTMQAQDGLPYKRYDRFTKGDPRKFTASEEERYELRACTRDNPAERWYLAAFDAHQEAFARSARSAPGLWIYFEALGAKISARYPDLAPTVRVFDVARAGSFLPFERAIEEAGAAGLPLVHYTLTRFVGLPDLFWSLEHQQSDLVHPTTFRPYSSEGWVLRQDDLIAKIRVADLARIKGRS